MSSVSDNNGICHDCMFWKNNDCSKGVQEHNRRKSTAKSKNPKTGIVETYTYKNQGCDLWTLKHGDQHSFTIVDEATHMITMQEYCDKKWGEVLSQARRFLDGIETKSNNKPIKVKYKNKKHVRHVAPRSRRQSNVLPASFSRLYAEAVVNLMPSSDVIMHADVQAENIEEINRFNEYRGIKNVEELSDPNRKQIARSKLNAAKSKPDFIIKKVSVSSILVEKGFRT